MDRKKPDVSFDKALIAIVKKYPLLYDQNHEFFRNSKERHAVWSGISQILKSSNIICRHRWKGLRDTWQRQKDFNNSGKYNPNRKKFEYFDLMAFIDTDYVPSPQPDETLEEPNLYIASVCSTTLSRSADQDALNGYCNFVTSNVASTSGIIIPKIEEVDLTMDECDFSDLEEPQCTVSGSVQGMQIDEQKSVQQHVVSNSESQNVSVNAKLSNSFLCEIDDECHIAGRRIGFQLKSVDDFQRTIAEKLISDIVFHAKMGNLTETSAVVFDCKQPQSS